MTTVPPPGSFIADELEARGWSQLDLAFVLGVSTQTINPIINGKRGIGPDMAKALGKAFDVPAEFFTNLQAAYDLAQARDPDPSVERRARLQDCYPIRDMMKRGWLEETDSEMLDLQIARFFKVKTLGDVPHMDFAAKKTYYDETPAAQLAWLFRVRQIAESMTVPAYSESKLRAAIEQMKDLRTEPEETRHVPRLLAECGIRFVVVEALPKAGIDGVCFWLNKKAPVIGMSLQRDRIDNFWFVLRHECEHTLQKHGQEKEVIDIDIEKDVTSGTTIPEEEKIANAAAADFCIPSESMADFVLRVKPFFSEQRVLAFANRMHIHPGLVVGQVQKRTGNYAFLRKYQSKIRQFVTPGAMVDGWGQVAPVSL
jgi:HTH-type transcriptional regulator/antitoxin HigA